MTETTATDPANEPTPPSADAAPPEPDDGDEGCNCGKPVDRHPLLTPDLVIVARERAREPELPEATVEIALRATLPTKQAGYDLVVVAPPDPETSKRLWSLMVEFAKREHRVFWLKPEHAPSRDTMPPTLTVLPLAAEAFIGEGHVELMAEVLEELRREHDIATALLSLPNPKWNALADATRDNWGWRTVSELKPREPGLPAELLAAESAADVLLSWLRSDPRGDGTVPLVELRTWPEKWRAVDLAVRPLWPLASVVVLMNDNLAYNKMCLASIVENTDYPNYEVVAVDNGSTDGTVEYLRDLAGRFPQVRLILNDSNRGFGPGNNQGLAAAAGDRFVLLNNDTIVPRGWLGRLLWHLDDPGVGLVGPASNRTCNEAQVDTDYQTYADYETVARQMAAEFDGQLIPIRMLAMYCTAFRRDLLDLVGGLDERYAVGMFEDEDYALRVKEQGLEVAWTPEVYVHHAYHASVGKLLRDGDYLRIFHANRERFEEKWGICWEPHRPRPTE